MKFETNKKYQRLIARKTQIDTHSHEHTNTLVTLVLNSRQRAADVDGDEGIKKNNNFNAFKAHFK